MDPHYLSFRENSTVKEAVEMIRFLSNAGVPLLYAYVVDDNFCLKGSLVMRDLLVSRDDTVLKDIMKTDVYSVNVNQKREDVAKEAIEKKYLAIPIVSDEGHLLGIIKYGDIIDLAAEEQTKDILKMFGAGSEERPTSSILIKIAKRLPWLKVNLLTAFMAGAVIGIFEETIAKVTALAIFLPIIAGQGGNTGAQSLAVVMRGLALEQIPPGAAGKVIFREVLAGLFNGLAVGVVTGLAAWIWIGNPALGIIIGVAMVLNMVLATFFGAVIPLIMEKIGLDPAQCSSIVLTTFTDVIGFFLLLGLAVLFQSYIL